MADRSLLLSSTTTAQILPNFFLQRRRPEDAFREGSRSPTCSGQNGRDMSKEESDKS
jgi:hypothetical protein